MPEPAPYSPPAPPRKLTPTEAQVSDWNKQYPLGTLVRRYKMMKPLREPAETHRTISPAFVLGGHTAAVELEGFGGWVALEALEVLEVPEVKPAQTKPVEPVKTVPKPVPQTLPKIPA